MSVIVMEVANVDGVSSRDVPVLQKEFGKNIFTSEVSRGPAQIFWDTVKEPMFLMLLAACVLYFILGQVTEGLMMLAAMTVVVSVSLYQEVKSSHALAALQQLTAQKVTVVRDGKRCLIASVELVPGDVMMLSEGMNVPADAAILQENDLSVNESVITGESVPAEKHTTASNNLLYQGTTINSGLVSTYNAAGPYARIFYTGWQCSSATSTDVLNRQKNELKSVEDFNRLYPEQ